MVQQELAKARTAFSWNFFGRSGSLLILGAATAATVTGCAKKPAPPAAPPPMPVSVVKVEGHDVAVRGEWVGTLDGFVNAQIQPQASGYLIRQNYREGSQVAKGQVLFQIDPRPFQAALEQAQGQLGQAQAQLGLATINVNRDTPLAQARAIARSQLDNDTQQKAQAEATVKTAQAAVATAQLNLSFTNVRSLIKGVAGQATIQVGSLVSPQSVLTAVSQLDPIKVYFSISDAEYLALTKRTADGGTDLLKATAGVPLALTLAGGEVYPHKGRIVFVDRQMNAQTGAIRVAAAFPNPGNLLRPGQFARVQADTETRHGALLVPQVAITEFQGLQQVYVAGADGKAHQETLQLGPQIGSDWIVDGGINAGALVITDNLQKLKEGAPVSPHQGPAVAPTAQTTPSAGR